MAIYRYDAASGMIVEATRREAEPQVHVINDNAEPNKGYLWHPAFGEHEQDKAYFSSKSKFRAETRARGFEEKGNDRDTRSIEMRRRDIDARVQENIKQVVINNVRSLYNRK